VAVHAEYGSVVGPAELALERYLHQQIPLSAAMGVRVSVATRERVQLAVPLAPNVNHNETAFGGSAAALATLSAWALLHLRLAAAGVQARLVIQRSTMEYEQPIPGDFEGACRFTDEVSWERFRLTLARRGRARLTLAAHLFYDERQMATFEGDFVALV
jgi:thioesterase domain-containing protein